MSDAEDTLDPYEGKPFSVFGFGNEAGTLNIRVLRHFNRQLTMEEIAQCAKLVTEGDEAALQAFWDNLEAKARQ